MSAAVEALLPALGDHAEWLRVVPGRPGEGDWAGTGDMERAIDVLLVRAQADPRRLPQLAARGVFADIAWRLVTPQVLTLSRQRRLPLLGEQSVHIELGGATPVGVAWDTEEILVLAGDPVATDPGVHTAGSLDELYRRLVGWSVTVLEPVVEAVRSRIRVGRNALWASVVDYMTFIGPDSTEPDPTGAVEELERFRAAAAGTPLGQKVPLLTVPHPGGDRLQVCRSVCCLYYKEPFDPDEEVPADIAGPWERYCTTCPLIPVEETLRRLLIDLEPDKETT